MSRPIVDPSDEPILQRILGGIALRPAELPATFVIPGPPATKKNSRRVFRHPRTGRITLAQSAQSCAWEESAALVLRSQWRGAPALARPVSMRAVFYRARGGGDLGNFISAACDALERARVVADDKWILSFDGSRLAIDRVNPRVEIELSEM